MWVSAWVEGQGDAAIGERGGERGGEHDGRSVMQPCSHGLGLPTLSQSSSTG